MVPVNLGTWKTYITARRHQQSSALIILAIWSCRLSVSRVRTHLTHLPYGVHGYRFACMCLSSKYSGACVYGLCSLETLILNYAQLQIPEVKEESTEKRRQTMADDNTAIRDKKQLFVPGCDIFFELSGNLMWWYTTSYVQPTKGV